MNQDLRNILTAASLRITAPRQAIFTTLREAQNPLSHVEIAQANPGVDKTSVYRTIDLFMSIGVVVGVAYGWKQRYELAAPFRPHHHHVHCLTCGKVTEITSEKLEKVIHTIVDDQSFYITGHTFEITGVCANCRAIAE